MGKEGDLFDKILAHPNDEQLKKLEEEAGEMAAAAARKAEEAAAEVAKAAGKALAEFLHGGSD